MAGCLPGRGLQDFCAGSVWFEGFGIVYLALISVPHCIEEKKETNSRGENSPSRTAAPGGASAGSRVPLPLRVDSIPPGFCKFPSFFFPFFFFFPSFFSSPSSSF